MWTPSSRKSLAAGAVLLVYFLLLAGGGLRIEFSPDDTMNIAFLHGWGQKSLGVQLAQALAVFTPEYRPVGGLYYRTLFAIFGFHPLPFRVAFYALLITNLALAGRWFLQLSGSGMTAACATLLFCFHPALAQLFYDNATVYDVLCALFVLLLWGRYVRIRNGGGLLAAKDVALIAVLYGGALGSKEMAIALPAGLVLYEAIFHPHLKNLRQRLQPILLLLVMTMVCMALKVFVPNSMSVVDNYIPRYQLAFLGNSYLHYYRQLFFDESLGAGGLAAILVAALLAAVALRSRLMIFGLVFANLSLLPVCLIPPRAGFVWYIPMLGYALFGGAAISGIGNSWIIARRLRAPGLVQPILFGCLVAVGYVFYSPRAADLGAPFRGEEQNLNAMRMAAKTAAPSLSPGSRVLMEGDPFPAASWCALWCPLFLLRLAYEDPTLWVDRAPHLVRDYNPGDRSLYALRIRWDGSQFHAISQAQGGGPPVAFTVTPTTVHRDHSIDLQFPTALGSCPIDAAYRMPEDELMRGSVWLHWTELDASGKGVAAVGADAERGQILIDRIRACGRAWVPAQGSFVIVP